MHRTLPTHPLTGARALGWRKARPGEDDTELYPIWPVLGGDGREDDDQDDDDRNGDQDDEDGSEDQDDAGDESDDDQDGDGDEDDGKESEEDEDAAALGEKGKRALARMKEKLKAERAKRRKAEEELSGRSGGDDETSPEAIQRRAEQAATAKANQRIVRSEVRAAAKGRLADPRDALTFLDLDQFEVDENGQVDEDEIADAIDDLLKNKPYLAAQRGRRFQGTGDGGAQRKAGRPRQLTKKDLDRMSPEEIVKAQDEGRLDDLLGVSS
ncbi:hypothetical protein [Streptomyces sp. CNQ085]|uniref:hypothetical protein n=1 Tax=Streptomyces sp. CNQ085 TaxID=2886944 RepID=UPI001F5110A9|nr:hypothetical protein [Streptomyces sp. CNQ085]MCI0386660.1 hypothetical protein [Streptomyces sp. CNQ085]